MFSTGIVLADNYTQYNYGQHCYGTGLCNEPSSSSSSGSGGRGVNPTCVYNWQCEANYSCIGGECVLVEHGTEEEPIVRTFVDDNLSLIVEDIVVDDLSITGIVTITNVLKGIRGTLNTELMQDEERMFFNATQINEFTTKYTTSFAVPVDTYGSYELMVSFLSKSGRLETIIPITANAPRVKATVLDAVVDEIEPRSWWWLLGVGLFLLLIDVCCHAITYRSKM